MWAENTFNIESDLRFLVLKMGPVKRNELPE